MICEANSRGANILNTSIRELTGIGFTRFVVPGFQSDFNCHCRAVIETGTRQTCVLKFLVGRDHYFFGQLESVREAGTLGGLKLIRTILSDITQIYRIQSALEISESQQQAVTELGQLALADTNLACLFEETLAKATDAMRLDTGEILEWIPDCDQFLVRATQGWKKGLASRKRIRGGRASQSGFTVLQGKPVLVRDIQFETRFKSPLGELSPHGVTSGMSVIIGKPDNIFGVLGVHSSKKRKFKKNDIIFLQSLAHILAAAVEQETSKTELKNSEKRLHFLSSHLLTAQEEERKKVAYMLHDDLGQSLTLLKLQVRAIEMKMGKECSEVRADCNHALENISSTIESVRKISHNLTPTVLEDLGLSVALKCLFEDFSRHFKVHIWVDMPDMDTWFAQQSKILVYRIFQEAFTNIARHANADEIWVSIGKQKSRYRFAIEDNGIGFDSNDLKEHRSGEAGLGLSTMNERVRILGGELRIENRGNGGTKIWFDVPGCTRTLGS
jgi:signal transduction histidine kinase